MSLNRRGDIWHYSIIDPVGKRHRGTTEKSDKREAQRVHDEIKFELNKLRPLGFTLKDALRAWFEDSPRTEKEKSAVRVLLRCYPDRAVDQIVPYQLTAALGGRANSTINRTLNIVNAAINLCHSRGQCVMVKIKRKKDPVVKLRFLTKDEWHHLYPHLQPHIQDIAMFAVSTGLRRANVLGLKWQQVDLSRKLVWIDAADAKGKKHISVPLSDQAVQVIRAQEGKSKEFVFTYRGTPIKDIKTSWGKALVKAGIDLVTYIDHKGDEITTSSFTFHDLRHTWASWHVQAGTPLAVLKELGGWSSMDMVLRYAHLSPGHLRGWVNNV